MAEDDTTTDESPKGLRAQLEALAEENRTLKSTVAELQPVVQRVRLQEAGLDITDPVHKAYVTHLELSGTQHSPELAQQFGVTFGEKPDREEAPQTRTLTEQDRTRLDAQSRMEGVRRDGQPVGGGKTWTYEEWRGARSAEDPSVRDAARQAFEDKRVSLPPHVAEGLSTTGGGFPVERFPVR